MPAIRSAGAGAFGIMRRNVIDRLALLCTLHADGPRTLRLLREAGCTSIDMLSNLAPERISKVLSLPAAAARRLTREAIHLRERLEPDLEHEEVTYPPAALARGVKPAPPSVRFDNEPLDRVKPISRLDMRDQELLNRVVERWRASELPTTGQELLGFEDPPKPLLDGPSLEQVEITPAERQPLDVRTEPLPRLLPQDLAGLDLETCATLEQAEICSLEELATCPADELVSRTGLPFTRIRTLQFRAGIRISERGPSVEPEIPQLLAELAPAELPEQLSPSDRPFVRPGPPAERASGLMWDDSGAAGPFA